MVASILFLGFALLFVGVFACVKLIAETGFQ